MYAGKVKHEWSMTAALRSDMRILKGQRHQYWQVNPLEERPYVSAFQAARDSWKQDG